MVMIICFYFMVISYMLGLIQCWLHVLNFDVRVSGLDGLFAHMCFVLFCCALPGRSYWCATHGFCFQVVCYLISFIVFDLFVILMFNMWHAFESHSFMILCSPKCCLCSVAELF